MIIPEEKKPIESWKEKQFNLLCHIDDLCRKNKIGMYLFSNTALAVYRDHDVSDFLMICIDIKNAEKFNRLVEADPGLGVRSMLNYDPYPYFELRVFDPKTIDFNLDTYTMFDCHSLFIKVKFIHHIPDDPKKAEKLTQLYRTFQDYIGVRFENREVEPYRDLKWMLSKSKLFSPSYVSHHTYKTLIKDYSGLGGPTKYITVNGKRFKSNLFKKTQDVFVGGHSFKIPADHKTYFRVQFGPEWMDHTIPVYVEKSTCFRDGDHSWEEYKKWIPEFSVTKYNKVKTKFESYKPDFLQYHRQVLAYFALIERTHYRFTLWQQYEPQKEQIRSMYVDGDYEGLNELLADYFTALEAMRAKKLGLCFDPEIFQIALELLRDQGRSAYADQLDALVPDVHRSPIRIKNHHGEYIEG